MPAKSQAQQRFMGMVVAMKRGAMPKSESKSVSKAAESMSEKTAVEYAKTKRKGLPKKSNKGLAKILSGR